MCPRIMRERETEREGERKERRKAGRKRREGGREGKHSDKLLMILLFSNLMVRILCFKT